MTVLTRLNRAVGRRLELHAVRKHRARLDRHLAPRYSEHLEVCRAAFGAAPAPTPEIAARAREFDAKGFTSLWDAEIQKLAAAMLDRIRREEARGVAESAGLTRQLVLKPRVFDFVSCLIQLRDLRAVGRIRESLPREKFYAKVADAETYYHILTTPPRDLGAERLLIVGPRNVHELFIAWLYGYHWKNANDTFDAVVMANTLAYSQDTFRCLSEVARVLKPGGRFAFSATYLHGGLQTAHIFGTQKVDPGNPGLDRIDW